VRNLRRSAVIAGVLVLSVVTAGCSNNIGLRDKPNPQWTAFLQSVDRPLTIPAIRQWTHQDGRFELTRDSRLLLGSSDETLMRTARIFAKELAVLGHHLPVLLEADTQARTGDIRLVLSPAASVPGPDGYTMDVSSIVTIMAPENAGVFYGTRTLLQLFTQDKCLNAGRAVDWPRYPERGLTLDIARKYFSAIWIERHIRELAYLKMNYLHLHISDDQGFGIDSKLVPRPAGSISPRLTKHEVKGLVKLSRKYFVSIVPEIDMPGHMGAALESNAAFQIKGPSGRVNKSVLDWANKDARKFAKDLIGEFIALFDGNYWHAGSDEILECLRAWCHPSLIDYARQYAPPGTPLGKLDGKDALHVFLNDIDEFVRSNGKQLRVWNDELKGGHRIPLNSDVVVDWWTNFSILSDWAAISPQELLSAGHQVMNHGAWPTYYVLGANPLFPNASVKVAYEQWRVNEFDGYTYLFGHPFFSDVLAAGEANNRGAALTVWADHPKAETEDEVAAHIAPRLRVMAQKTWESAALTSDYPIFEEIAARVGGAPGF
jgi:hexosaminidase